MQTLILAGGMGTRLGEETKLIPKPMVEIGGYPILWHIMKIYSHYGYNDFIILAPMYKTLNGIEPSYITPDISSI